MGSYSRRFVNRFIIIRMFSFQQKKFEIESTDVFKKAFTNQSSMTIDDIPSLVAMLREKPEADMDLVAAEFTFNAMEAFYKIYH